jgi:hypothetical protein
MDRSFCRQQRREERMAVQVVGSARDYVTSQVHGNILFSVVGSSGEL